MWKKIVLASAFAGLVACGGMSNEGGETASDNPEAAATHAINAAKKEFDMANAKGYAWRDTAKMIAEAEKLKSEGKLDMAMKTAKKAEQQSIAALKQYEDQKNAANNY